MENRDIVIKINSMQEIEAKFRVEDHAPVAALLNEYGAELVESTCQRDTFFDRPGGEFRNGGCSLRLRVCDPPGRGIITWKGPIEENIDVKIRKEIEISADPPDSAFVLMESLGFERFFVIEKRRSSYRFGECRIELDELPLLGLFVEIEGPSRQAVEEARRKLRIEAEHVPQSYLHMLVDHCDENGLSPESATFG